jgi:hypothetical protein
MARGSFGKGRWAQLRAWTVACLFLAACSGSSDSNQDASDGPVADQAALQPDLPAIWEEAIVPVDSAFARDTGTDAVPDAPIDSATDAPLDTRTADVRETSLDGVGLDGAAVDGGAACTKASDCTSGHCVQGVCCDRACTGVCEYCPRTTAAGTGICVPVPAGLDPLDACTDDGPSTCGKTGVCDGKGACALSAAGVLCRSPHCSGNLLVTASVCDGAGACVTGSAVSCGGYACVAELGRCANACSGAATDGGCAGSPDGAAGR